MKKLIFDLGFFNGEDTKYYLQCGYKVISVEMNTKLYEVGLKNFSKEIKENKLILLNNAFSETFNKKIPFYVHEKNLDWSTCDKNKTKFWECDPEVRYTKTINLKYLFNRFGVPYYIKTDIEGFDYLVLKQLCNMNKKPKFLSFELSRLDYWKTFSYLYLCGYSKFQLINQLHNKEYSSGKFGEYLENKWMNFDKCLTKYMKYKELKEIDNVNLALGWVDIHAKL